MEQFIIEGGNRLEGSIINQGAKNSALGILVASMLSCDTVELRNLPDIYDVQKLLDLMREIGAEVHLECGCLSITPKLALTPLLDADLAGQVRYSILFLGLLLARVGHVVLPLPGGCCIGERKYDMHLDALRCMGAEVTLSDTYIEAKVRAKLVGTRIKFYHPTDTGTMNIVIAASLAQGTTVIENASLAPEIVDFMGFLQHLGVAIRGVGTHTVAVDGKDAIGGGAYTIMPDRMAAFTYAVASVITAGEINIANCMPADISSELDTLVAVGANVDSTSAGMVVTAKGCPKAVDVVTEVYPGFHTDAQSSLVPLLCVSDGRSTVTETIFDRRFGYTEELSKLGADIRVEPGDFLCPNGRRGQKATISGVKKLHGGVVTAPDLRGGVGLLLAALAAEGQTTVQKAETIGRGYENMVDKLTSVGAVIKGIKQ